MKETHQFVLVLVLFYMSFLYFNNNVTETYSADEEKYSSWLTKVKYAQQVNEPGLPYFKAMQFQPYDQKLDTVFANQKEYNLDFLSNLDFKPQCCPSQYSTSAGCACMTPEKLNYISKRGGNNHSI